MRILSSIVLLLIVGCGDNSSTTTSSLDPAIRADGSTTENSVEDAGFISWLDAEFATEMDFSPLAKSRQGDKSAHGELDDVSEAAQDRRLEWRRDSVSRMHAGFSRDQLDAEGQLSWDLWEYQLETVELNTPFRRHRFIFGRGGPQSSLPNNLINYHRVDTLEDMQAYISRLNQSRRYLLQYLERAQLAVADGVRAPFFDYDQAISEIGRVTSGAPFTEAGDSDLWTDIIEKISALQESGTISGQQAEELERQSRGALLSNFKPAYDEILAWLVLDRANVSAQAQGAWSLPNGEEYYNVRLRTMTTLPLTADEIHQLGISEVARIQTEMEQIKRQVGFEGSLQDFFNFMREDDQFYFPNTDQGRSDYLKLADELLAAMSLKLPDYFGILPKAALQVRRVEAFRETPGGAAHYARGTIDGSRPGTFYVHLADMRATAVNRLENLSYHEGLPGHHMQISIQQELENLPRFRSYRGYTAFSEGWGLYAEYLGKEMGGYADPYSDFGRLSGEIWRAVRLVVDTGIHAQRWTQDQAVQYALQNSPRPELSVQSEVRRYFNNPAQATAYKIGMLKIMELRARAETELGDDFSIKAFHDAILGSGSLPMPALEAKIDAWIASVRNN
ncbi:MAG: DUF885 domain-containing protein [Proteobacteria bacterium]|nr:DUF885 domain-containing protein [Pseudomonadota bacterium]MCH8175895.1 DUF885 domain-containing protein [Pseudomonadota bacterium]